MMDLTFEQLETLVALSEDGTFEAAARRLHVTASAVSQRVRAMELAAGQVVLQRTNPIAMTAAGEVLLRYAREVRLLERDAEHALQLDAGAAATSLGLAINADSLNTWFLPAIAPLVATDNVVFDIHREDQENTTSLLRAGVVVAALTSTATPVQGCSSTALGIMRYRAVASTAFADRWMTSGGLAETLSAAPAVVFDRDDELQDRFHEDVAGRPLNAPRHFVPASADFASAIRLGFGWGMLPELQCAAEIEAGTLVDLAPKHPLDVPLYWQRWNLATPLLDAVSAAVTSEAKRVLRREKRRNA